MHVKRLLSGLFLTILMGGACFAVPLKDKETGPVYATGNPSVTFTHADMGFKQILSGTGPYVGYVRQSIEGENMNVDEAVSDDPSKPDIKSEETSAANTSGGKCLAHIGSGYVKFDVNIQGATHAKVRFTLKMAHVGGGEAAKFYTLFVGSKDSTEYVPEGTITAGAAGQYWNWEEHVVAGDIYLPAGTTTIYLKAGGLDSLDGNSGCNLDLIYIDLFYDKPHLTSLGTTTLEAEYLDSELWNVRDDMFKAGQTSYLENPSESNTSNGLSIARFDEFNTFTLHFSAEEQATFDLSFVFANYEAINFNGLISVTLDDEEMPSPTPGTLGGRRHDEDFYNWTSAPLNRYTVEAGDHELQIVIADQKPNIDCFTFNVTSYGDTGVETIVDATPTEAVTGTQYGENVLITDANATVTREYDEMNGASFATTRVLLTVEDEVTYKEGNSISVYAASTSAAAKLKVYCGENQLGEEKTLTVSTFEYLFALEEGQSGYIQIEITGSGVDTIYVKSVTVYGETTGNTLNVAPVSAFGGTLNTTLTCDGYARTYKEADWNTLKSSYNALAPEIRRIISATAANTAGDTTAQALARYDYIIAKYIDDDDDYTDDFMNRLYNATAVHGVRNHVTLFNANSQSILFAVMFFAGLLTLVIGTLYCTKKMVNRNK